MTRIAFTRRQVLAFLTIGLGWRFRTCRAEHPGIRDAQPYFASVSRALEALERLGSPVGAGDAHHIGILAQQSDPAAVDAAEKILDRYTLLRLSLDAGGQAEIAPGGAPRVLIEQGWRIFLVRVANPGGKIAAMTLTPDYFWGAIGPGQMWPDIWHLAARAALMDSLSKAPRVERMWLSAQLYATAPIIRDGKVIASGPLSGLPIEYLAIQVFSRDRGRRSAKLRLTAYGRADDSVSTTVSRELEFDCVPSRTVTFSISDMNGLGCVASLTLKDKLSRTYPPLAMRLAPDLAFQPQVYRGDGETMRLPDGDYTIEGRRGPEYLRTLQTARVDASHDRIEVKLERWIDPAKWGWYSGDPHIHAGGCAHYQTPTEGVSPETMIRQVRGEALSIGDVLSWAPSWYYQKQFFTGHAVSPAALLEHPDLQAANHASLQPHATPEDSASTLRYDVEVSGFPSSHGGHLMLLRLKEQDYPGTSLIEDWPSWNLPILRWAKAQGALTGYAHCGNGLAVDSADLPNFEIPPMDSNGAQEAIIDVTHGALDFLAGCDTLPTAELNAWYHMLNCGFRLALIGETDYPCASDERLGAGRTYVRLERPPVGDTGYEAWIGGFRQGRLYCGDGRSHFLEFTVNGRHNDTEDLVLHAEGPVAIEALVAARLEPEITPVSEVARRAPYGWHIEKARIGGGREVPVELVINGHSVDRAVLTADGKPRRIRFNAKISRSSWIALRILPSAHTHPLFVRMGEQSIRASKRSAQWCRACVDKVWEIHLPFIRESERMAAADAFDHAKRVYDTIANECEVD